MQGAGKFTRGSPCHGPGGGVPGGGDFRGGVVVGARPQSEGGADGGAHREVFRHSPSPAATVLAGVGRFHQHDSLTGACCLIGEDGTERCPACIADALGQAVVPYQVGDPLLFPKDGVVLPEPDERYLVVVIVALSPNMLLG